MRTGRQYSRRSRDALLADLREWTQQHPDWTTTRLMRDKPTLCGAIYRLFPGRLYEACLLAGLDADRHFANNVRPQTIWETCRSNGMRVPLGFWGDPGNVRQVIRHVLRSQGLSVQDAPSLCSKRWFVANGLESLIKRYDNSPAALFEAVFPRVFPPGSFRTVAEDRTPRTTEVAKPVTCGSCREWFRPRRVLAPKVRYCPYCGGTDLQKS